MLPLKTHVGPLNVWRQFGVKGEHRKPLTSPHAEKRREKQETEEKNKKQTNDKATVPIHCRYMHVRCQF